MGFSYDIKTSKKDKLSSNCLMACHKISAVIDLFLSTFLVAYIYSLSSDIHKYVYNVALYLIVTYASLCIVYYLLGYLLEKTNRSVIYRCGIIARAGLVVFAIFFGRDLAQLIPLAGILNGVSQAIYYSAYDTMKHEMVSRSSMRTFVLLDQALGKAMDIFVPIVLGALIEVSTYAQVSIYIFVVCVIQIGLSFCVKSKRPENSKFTMKEYFSALNNKPEAKAKIKSIYILGIIYGLTTIVPTLVNICIMIELGSSFKLGMIISICAVISIFGLVAFRKFTQLGKRELVLCIIAFIPLLSTILFVFFPSITTIYVYNLGVVTTKIIYQYLYESQRFSILKEEGLYEYIVEHHAICNMTLGVSRVFTFILMFLFNLDQSLVGFKVFLCIMSSMFTLIILALMLYERRFFSDKKEKIEEEKTFKIIRKCLKEPIWEF